MEDPVEKAERRMSALMRLGVSLVLPAWAVAMVVLGVLFGSPWWLVCGVLVGIIGLVMFIGSPVADRLFGQRQPDHS